MFEAGAREDGTSRLYYAVFHAAGAALAVRGRYARTHSGQIALFYELGGLLDEAAAFVERCRAVVVEALAAGPDEADPPPDY